jgi:hypothetical protein
MVKAVQGIRAIALVARAKQQLITDYPEEA